MLVLSHKVEYSKKKCIAVRTIWKTKVEKPSEVEEFYSTANLAIEIIDRVLKHIEDFGESNDIGSELYQLQNTVDQYKSHLSELVRGKKLNRHLDNSVRRKKIAKLNALLHSDVATVLEVLFHLPFRLISLGKRNYFYETGPYTRVFDARATKRGSRNVVQAGK